MTMASVFKMFINFHPAVKNKVCDSKKKVNNNIVIHELLGF